MRTDRAHAVYLKAHARREFATTEKIFATIEEMHPPKIQCPKRKQLAASSQLNIAHSEDSETPYCLRIYIISSSSNTASQQPQYHHQYDGNDGRVGIPPYA